MGKVGQRLVLAATVLAIGGCEAGQPPPPEIEDTVFDEQVGALEKAQSVEALNEERLKKLREAEGSQTGGGTGD